MSVIEHSDDDWTPPTGPWTEADHWRWAANHHREFRVRAEEDRARLTERLEGAVDENEKLRLQVAALENDGMELAAKLGEAEDQIARLTASGRQ